MSRPFLQQSISNGIATLTLDRPESRNALSVAMMTALEEALAAAADDARVRAIVLGASGSVFCAGHDLKELTAHRSDAGGGRAFFQAAMAQCARLMQALQHVPQPVIARVQGLATAAGCQLVASCDLAVAAREARFATPGVDIGLFCATPMVALSRNVARKPALEMLLTGEAIDADTAERLGLVNHVVAQTSLDAAIQTLASKIAAKPKPIVTLGKRAFYRQAEMTRADAYEAMCAVMVENMLMQEAADGIGAFLSKRKSR